MCIAQAYKHVYQYLFDMSTTGKQGPGGLGLAFGVQYSTHCFVIICILASLIGRCNVLQYCFVRFSLQSDGVSELNGSRSSSQSTIHTVPQYHCYNDPSTQQCLKAPT